VPGLESHQPNSVKKIEISFVKKSELFERSEFSDFRKKFRFFRDLGVRRHFLFTSFCCSKEVKARAARAQKEKNNFFTGQ
jgi:hypothetical protein